MLNREKLLKLMVRADFFVKLQRSKKKPVLVLLFCFQVQK